eukprot:TRINITY_DN11615_c0_g1_i1.p1 TRINITY_DN11615_c0_g1~~TRINITY_DN11615_c0_g1_i1.p1  ORF type:complete len:240 (+),score=94.86 TRINITY_DN11615_c0_g1_i1:58-777(+)
MGKEKKTEKKEEPKKEEAPKEDKKEAKKEVKKEAVKEAPKASVHEEEGEDKKKKRVITFTEEKVKAGKEKSAVMRNIRIEKLVVNICAGESGDKLTKAARVLKELTEQEPVFSSARLTIRTFGIRRNDKIACYVTVRGKKAEEILAKGLAVHEFELKDSNFSSAGHFGFGIQEHIDLGLKYDPSMGIYGMDFYVVLSRPGFRVARRKHCRSKIGKHQRISKEQAQKWFITKFQGNIRAE